MTEQEFEIGIDDSKASAQLLFTGWINRNCKLDDVVVDLAFVSKDDQKLPLDQQVPKAAITFNFSNNKIDEKRILKFVKYQPTGEKTEKSIKAEEIRNQQFKHIYEVYTGGKAFPAFKAKSYGDFFSKIADIFNGVTRNEAGEEISRKPIYRDANGTPIAVNIKAIYNKGNIGLGFPNFIERYDPKRPEHTTFSKSAKEQYEPATNNGGLDIETEPEEKLPF